MIIKTNGTTRKVQIYKDTVRKICYNGCKYENKNEYDNYIKYKDAEVIIVNKILKFTDNIIEAVKCQTLKEYFKENDIIVRNYSSAYMDDIFLHLYNDLGNKLNYREKRRYLMNTKLDFDEFQMLDNWGINPEGELVLIDYSR